MTAETAAALPALVLVTVAALWAVTVVGVRLDCADAAAMGARFAARGEPLDAVRRVVARAAPPGARVTVSRNDAVTRVVIAATVRPPWSVPLPPATVQASASSLTEPGADAPLP